MATIPERVTRLETEMANFKEETRRSLLAQKEEKVEDKEGSYSERLIKGTIALAIVSGIGLLWDVIREAVIPLIGKH